MNNVSKTIGWADKSWNPVTGCNHGCSYCYARRIAMRFTGHFKPTIHRDRLKQPYVLKTPSKIFVCSMADLFGDWVPTEWINKVLSVMRCNPQHTFQFLTKNPKRYYDFFFEKNCWLGVTIDKPNQRKIDLLLKNKEYKFISFEPILGDMSKLDLTGIDLCIIGRDTSPGAKRPKQEWIVALIDKAKKNNIEVFLKGNLALQQPKNNG